MANGNRFMTKAEMQQMQKFGGISLPPKDIESLREFYFQRAVMQIQEPCRLYDIPARDVKAPQSQPQNKMPSGRDAQLAKPKVQNQLVA